MEVGSVISAKALSVANANKGAEEVRNNEAKAVPANQASPVAQEAVEKASAAFTGLGRVLDIVA